MRPKYLSKREIEADAARLLREYGHEYGELKAPPVPVDDIAENYLHVTVDFDDLPGITGVPDALGATWMAAGQVFIDESLDPIEYPEKEGRYNFTLGHEVGHTQLHWQYFVVSEAQLPLIPRWKPAPSIVCRLNGSKDPFEWQADYWSAAFLMPRSLVYDAWRAEHGNLTPLCFDDYAWTWSEDSFYRSVATPFASLFRVSIQAMTIRLLEVGLLRKERGLELQWG